MQLIIKLAGPSTWHADWTGLDNASVEPVCSLLHYHWLWSLLCCMSWRVWYAKFCKTRSKGNSICQPGIFHMSSILGKSWVDTALTNLRNWSQRWYKWLMTCSVTISQSCLRTSETHTNELNMSWWWISGEVFMATQIAFVDSLIACCICSVLLSRVYNSILLIGNTGCCCFDGWQFIMRGSWTKTSWFEFIC